MGLKVHAAGASVQFGKILADPAVPKAQREALELINESLAESPELMVMDMLGQDIYVKPYAENARGALGETLLAEARHRDGTPVERADNWAVISHNPDNHPEVSPDAIRRDLARELRHFAEGLMKREARPPESLRRLQAECELAEDKHRMGVMMLRKFPLLWLLVNKP